MKFGTNTNYTNNYMSNYTGFVKRLYSVDIMTSELARQTKILSDFTDAYLRGRVLLKYITEMPFVSSYTISYLAIRINRFHIICRQIEKLLHHAQKNNSTKN